MPAATSKSLILNIITNGSPQIWRNPDDRSREFVNGIDPWIELAKLAERGKIHSLFIADHLSWFDTYQGDYKASAKTGVFAPRIDPAAVVTALSSVTKGLGFGITFSTISEHPYHFARRLASLDLLTNGRVGWNIVSSYLDSLGPNLLNGEPIPEHDERYIKTEEYLDVVYKLLLSSWRDDAVKYDKEAGVFADPDLIRKIDHKGKYFSVEGPSITEPTPQRFPFIIQAGTSKKGKDLAARNAELVFLDGRSVDVLAKDIKEIRDLAETFGRERNSIKFVVSSTPIVAKTHDEAVEKAAKIKSFGVSEGTEVALSGIAGIDLSEFESDDEIEFQGSSNNLRTMADNIFKRKKQSNPTKRDVINNYTSKIGSLTGTPSEIADEIEKWVAEYDIDGFNLGLAEFPASLNDIVELLIPELQTRGLFHKDYTSDTLRENVKGVKGQTFVDEDHPAFNLRWTSGFTKEAFEKKIGFRK